MNPRSVTFQRYIRASVFSKNDTSIQRRLLSSFRLTTASHLWIPSLQLSTRRKSPTKLAARSMTSLFMYVALPLPALRSLVLKLRSCQMAWYTNRAAIAAIYTAAELHQLASPETAHAFLDSLVESSTALKKSVQEMETYLEFGVYYPKLGRNYQECRDIFGMTPVCKLKTRGISVNYIYKKKQRVRIHFRALSNQEKMYKFIKRKQDGRPHR
jgi:hypothetical protein